MLAGMRHASLTTVSGTHSIVNAGSLFGAWANRTWSPSANSCRCAFGTLTWLMRVPFELESSRYQVTCISHSGPVHHNMEAETYPETKY